MIAAGRDDAIQGIEEEVGIHLRFEVAQLVGPGQRLGPCHPQLAAMDPPLRFLGTLDRIEAEIDREPHPGNKDPAVGRQKVPHPLA